jgi:hypothetical protein
VTIINEISYEIQTEFNEYCLGDTIELSVVVQEAAVTNELTVYEYVEDDFGIERCGIQNNECRITSQIQPRIEGPGIIWHSTYPTVEYCRSTINRAVSCRAVPTGNPAVYTISTNTREFYDAVDESCALRGYMEDVTVLNQGYGEKSIAVINPSAPSISVNKTIVQPNEEFVITIECEDYHEIILKEACDPDPDAQSFSFPLYRCFEDDMVEITLYAPDYATELSYEALLFYALSNNCISPWSDAVTVSVQIPEPSIPNVCGDSDIDDTEIMLQDQNLINARDDYHTYFLESTVCNTVDSGCSVDDVWNFMKSKQSYQVPLPKDFGNISNDGFDYLIPGRSEESSSNNTPISNCSDISINLYGFRWAIGIAASVVSLFPGGPSPNASVISQDPVYLIINENNKCITNYTKPGHILHPGKVTRCISLDDCGRVVVRSKGTGYSEYGSNSTNMANYWFAQLLSNTNESLGPQLFQQIDDRLIDDFNN